MSLIPIKKLPNSPNRTSLMNYINEKSIKLDKDEERLPAALLAVENASEIARILLQADGVFEKISEAIATECNCTVPVNYQCKLTKEMTLSNKNRGVEIVHLGTTLNKSGAGHYIGAIVNHASRKIWFSDSMGTLGGETNKFVNALGRSYPNYTFGNQTNTVGQQPTGGFYQPSIAGFKQLLRNKQIDIMNLNPEIIKQFYDISQMDELSQHHFCYIESFVYICHRLLGTPIGSYVPRNRIILIKRVVWGLIHKFDLLRNVSPAVRNYFLNTFKYYIKFTTLDNKNLTLKGGVIHIPNNIPTIRRGAPVPLLYKMKTVEIPMPNVTPSTSMKRLMELALVHA
jgi:hypothetical protein